MSEGMNANNIVVLNLAEAKRPVFREFRGGAYVRFGEDNLYPMYLQDLYDSATKHGAIVGGKATYISGNGWQIKDGKEDPNTSAFIARVNRHGESLADVTKKAATDVEIFGGVYLQIIWSRATRRIAEIYHIDYTRMRSNWDNTQFRYRESWVLSGLQTGKYQGYRPGHRDEKIYPAFNPSNPRGSQILYLKEYRPGVLTYAMPSYMQALDYIAAEIQVGRHVLGNSQTGFTASKSITFINGEPTDDEKKKITKKFSNVFTGADGKKFLLNFVNSPDQKPIVDDLGASDLTKEDFTRVDDLIQTNIFTGHKITTPALFGIATPGALGQRKELQTGFELFKNTYVNGKQQFLETAFNMLARFAGASMPISIIPTDQIGLEFSADLVSRIAPRQWTLDALGIDATKYPDQTPAILAMLKGGMPPPEVTSMRAAFSTDDDDAALALFAQMGKEKSKYTVIKSRKVKMAAETEDFMEDAQLSFADKQINKLEASILDLIHKDKHITPEVLASTLNVEVKDITTALKSLSDMGALEVSGAKGEETRTLTKPLKDLQEGVQAKTRSFSVMYSYEGPEDSKNRPFCAKMMELGRYYTRTDIESISSQLGYSVWDRRGGFYTNPNTGETTPYCRHSWMSHVVMKN